METRVDEVASDIFRLSTYIPDADMTFNQYVVRAEQPLLFHTGMRALFPLVSEAVARVVPIAELRWITFGHVEADECGAMNMFLAATPDARVAHGATACAVQVNDWADRAPVPLAADQVMDLGGKVVRNIDTPQLPHGWDAHVLYEETTRTLLCGDLFTQMGPTAVLTSDDLIEPALAAERHYGPTALTPTTGPMIRSLADLAPQRLALMHGPVYAGDAAHALVELAEGYEAMLDAAESAVRI